MKMIIGTDHRGYVHKEHIKKKLPYIEWIDIGCFSEEPVDYPTIAHQAVELIDKTKTLQAILICGSGIGMSIAANRFKGIFAALVWNSVIAKQAKEQENANILVIPASYVDIEQSIKAITAWLDAQFLNGNYAIRCSMIDRTLKN